MPTEHRIEIYQDSFVGPPIIAFHSDTPFMSVHVGDYLDPSIWKINPASRSRCFKVIAVMHLIPEIENSTAHSLSVCVQAVPRPA